MRSHPIQGNPFLRSTAGQGAAAVVARLRERGFEAWLAGGCVRDAVLGESPHDFDVATAARPEDVRPLFECVVETGPRFGTLTVLIAESATQVTTFRAEGDYVDGRRPTRLTFGVSLVEDARRRDFTMNALYADPFSGDVLDFVGGLDDLRARVVRAVGDPGERFDEDALRMLRAVRFTTRLGARLDEATASAARRRPHLLRRLSAERISEELTKMLTHPRAAAAVALLEGFAFLDEVLPEVARTRGCPQPPQFHPEGDVYVHTLDVLDRLERKTLTLALAALFHDVGKPLTLAWTDRIRTHGHEGVSAELAQERLRALRFSGDVVDAVSDLVLEHIRLGSILTWRRAKQLRFLSSANVDEHRILHRADRESQGGSLEVEEFLRTEVEALRNTPPAPKPLLTGDDLKRLGLVPGPRFKVLLDAVRDAQLEGSIGSADEARELVRRLEGL
jgi:poly(A) polymerase